MEIWNREELYFDVWEQPLIKLTEKYAVSAVMLGKVCRKLHENFCHDCGSSPQHADNGCDSPDPSM